MRKFLSSLFSPRLFSAMRPLVAVVGATGTGKSKLAVDIASRFNGEIINGDAMQMYRGLPIITNQIPVEECNGIPHHLINCIDLEESPWRISRFRKECLRLIDDIHSRGKLPVLVGGTHYYTQSVLFQDQLVARESDLSEEEVNSCPAEDVDSAVKWPILDAEPELVLQKLRKVDPIMAERWHPKDTRKIRRSLEIYFQTGKPASQVYAEQRQPKPVAARKDDPAAGAGKLRFNTMIFWVHSEKSTLQERLFKRVDAMVDQGLLSEASRMTDYIQKNEAQDIIVDQTRGVWISIGFKELAPYFDALKDSSKTEKELESIRQSCIESVKIATRQYATSQIKWIRNKLWNGLAEVGMTSRLYILDSTDVEDWEMRITEPSERLVEALLNDGPLPDPKSLSELARVTLDAKETQPLPSNQGATKCITCDICRKTMINEEQWKVHMHSSAHKRVLKSLARKGERAAYLRRQQESLENTEQHVQDSTKELDSQTQQKEVVE